MEKINKTETQFAELVFEGYVYLSQSVIIRLIEYLGIRRHMI